MRCPWYLALMVIGCDPNRTTGSPPDATPPSSTPPSTTVAAAPSAQVARTRVGSALAVSETGDAVIVAEEDRGALWRVATPVTEKSIPERHDMPGRPAQVVALEDRVLVTIRDPGLLLVLDPSLKEVARVPLPADAWGLAVTTDAKTALVTSAWTHRVTAVDLVASEVRWSVDVAREPRGVVIPKQGDHAYVTHLVGTDLTRVDGLTATTPSLRRIGLPAAPSRSPDPGSVTASLGYAAVLSPDEDRLFVPRHALGAVGGWDGVVTVDVLGTGDDRPLAPTRRGRYRPTKVTEFVEPMPAGFDLPLYLPSWTMDSPPGALPEVESFFVQPRAVVYRKATQSLLVASEGTDEVVELDARLYEPALAPKKRYRIGGNHGKAMVVAGHGGAPSGIALSPDESLAYVFCRTTSDLAVLPLVPFARHTSPDDTLVLALSDEDPLLEGVSKSDPKRRFREAAALGRKLFYNALDDEVSGGLACAGCHPDGRDDGHVWTEVTTKDDAKSLFVGGPAILSQRTADIGVFGAFSEPKLPSSGRARQTPMLAGRLRGRGVFGWRGESETLVDRVEAGFRLHRWRPSDGKKVGGGGHAGAIASFLLAGLVEPPRPTEPLTPEQERGKALFASHDIGCSGCHLQEDQLSNWTAVKVGVPDRRSGYDDETALPFKTPSLVHVGGTPPYYHDGSVATLSDLVARIGDRMGNTARLTAEDQRALVAYLETL
ncbi:MAG: hypothetical protein R3B72_11230 [Polyangiaceae bacterium]